MPKEGWWSAMRMQLPVAACWVNGSPLAGSSGSHHGGKWLLCRKLTRRLCSAMEHRRPTVAGQRASGNRQVSNSRGPN